MVGAEDMMDINISEPMSRRKHDRRVGEPGESTFDLRDRVRGKTAAVDPLREGMLEYR